MTKNDPEDFAEQHLTCVVCRFSWIRGSESTPILYPNWTVTCLACASRSFCSKCLQCIPHSAVVHTMAGGKTRASLPKWVWRIALLLVRRRSEMHSSIPKGNVARPGNPKQHINNFSRDCPAELPWHLPGIFCSFCLCFLFAQEKHQKTITLTPTRCPTQIVCL